MWKSLLGSRLFCFREARGGGILTGMQGRSRSNAGTSRSPCRGNAIGGFVAALLIVRPYGRQFVGIAAGRFRGMRISVRDFASSCATRPVSVRVRCRSAVRGARLAPGLVFAEAGAGRAEDRCLRYDPHGPESQMRGFTAMRSSSDSA